MITWEVIDVEIYIYIFFLKKKKKKKYGFILVNYLQKDFYGCLPGGLLAMDRVFHFWKRFNQVIDNVSLSHMHLPTLA